MIHIGGEQSIIEQNWFFSQIGKFIKIFSSSIQNWGSIFSVIENSACSIWKMNWLLNWSKLWSLIKSCQKQKTLVWWSCVVLSKSNLRVKWICHVSWEINIYILNICSYRTWCIIKRTVFQIQSFCILSFSCTISTTISLNHISSLITVNNLWK